MYVHHLYPYQSLLTGQCWTVTTGLEAAERMLLLSEQVADKIIQFAIIS